MWRSSNPAGAGGTTSRRLAERSGEATKQIEAIVKTIQADTQDAVAAMERSTQGVVEGAKLSDNAGTALTEIDQVSRRLAELIEEISQSASKEAESANVVAGNIQHIFAVTEQTGEGTRSTAQQGGVVQAAGAHGAGMAAQRLEGLDHVHAVLPESPAR